MLSRARYLAAVTLLVGCLAAPAAWAQATNLEAGKSASQLFAGTCNACHKSPRGLLKTVSAASLPGFLREHYTTSGDMASQLSSFLISNGASDSRQAKQGADKDKQGAADPADRQGRKMRNAPAQEAARPDADAPAGESGRERRKRLARPGEPSEDAKPLANAPAAIERSPEGRKLSAKQRLGRPVEEPPTAKGETPKAEPGADDKPKGEVAKEELGNAERTKPDAESKTNEAKTNDTKPAEAKSTEAKSTAIKSEPANMEAPKDGTSGEKAMVRRDPVPPVTPAPPAASTPAPAVASSGSAEPAAPRPPALASPEPSAVTASAPPPPPSAGPPAPPISQ
jgi:hypothetical protein